MVSVIFGLNSQDGPKVPRVSIRPTDTRWNDFGYNFHAIAKIAVEVDGPALELRALVIPIKSFDGNSIDIAPNFDSWLARELAASPDKKWLDASTDLTTVDFPRFVVLLEGESSYRKLAESIRDQKARGEVLLSMNDLVMLRENKIFEPLTEMLLHSKQFQLGVMRSGSAFRAIHRGRRYLWGNFTPYRITDARSAFSFRCPLRGFHGEAHSLTVAFNNNKILSDRIHCLVGRNGTGKTRLLRELILCLGDLAAKSEKSGPFIDNFQSTAREGSTEYAGEAYTRVMAISFDAESIFPSAVRSDSPFEYYLANLHRTEIEENSTNVSTHLLVDIMRGSDGIGEKSRWQVFRDALRGYVEISELFLPLLDDANHSRAISVGERKWVSAVDLNGIGEQSSLELYSMLDFSREVCFMRDRQEVHLSSGERMYFRFALNLLSHIDTAFVLVIDEPETHLHPNLVCDFMNLLYEVLTATKSIALIATHSAYVIREVPTHCAHVFSIGAEREPSERFVYLKTLGASIESISQAIFADSNAKKFHQRLIRSMASEGLTLDEIIDAYAELVSPEMLSQVASLLAAKASSKEGE